MPVLGQIVRVARFAKGWGPAELATRAGISRTSLYALESGRTRNPRARVLAALAGALGTTVDELVGRAEGEAIQAPAFPRTFRTEAEALAHISELTAGKDGTGA